MQPPGWTEVHAGGVSSGRVVGEDKNWVQDPDVLDTWFSSWLWPFATMDEETRKKFYPTSDLVTGPDIIFFWVARMIMAGLEFMEAKPFSNVYFTGIIRDKQGRKMSKSLGNSPDPIDLIAKYGADGLRFGIIRIAPQGQDIHFDEQEIEQGRNFCNKLWNACRLRQMQQPAQRLWVEDLKAGDLTSDEKAILWRLNRAITEINILYSRYEFSQIAQRLYELFWTYYCDWFVEASKASLFAEDERRRAVCLAVMDHCLSAILRLLHPYMPFITEELWQSMDFRMYKERNDVRMPTIPMGAADAGASNRESIMLADWPEPLKERLNPELGLTEDMVKFVEAKYALITAGRNLRAHYKIPANQKVRFQIIPEIELSLLQQELPSIQQLLNAESVEVVSESKHPGIWSAFGAIHLPLEGQIDLGAEKKRIQDRIKKIEKDLAVLDQKLANPDFSKAPQQIIEKTKLERNAKLEELSKAKKQLEDLGLWE
jgi:valyl-tRNA synthetase